MKAEQAQTDPPAISAPLSRKRIGVFIFGAAILIAAYSSVLLSFSHYVLETDLQQHVALVPFICGYLIWRDRQKNSLGSSINSSRLAAALAAVGGVIAVSINWKLRTEGMISLSDALSLRIFSLLIFLLAFALLTLGWVMIRPHLFAVCFLIFAVPLPDIVVHASSIFLQHVSADAAQVILKLSGTPVTREGLLFHIPRLDFLVAEECSGFRATFILFMISLLAGHLLLQKRSYKLLLVASVLPIAIVRNGIRISVITWLTSHVNPHIIDSPLHHQGGPLFFLMGLVPFLGCLWWLRRRDTDSSSGRLQMAEEPQ
jgi:exosortase